MRRGDRVRLASLHPGMSKHLQGQLGHEGVIQMTQGQERCLVSFEGGETELTLLVATQCLEVLPGKTSGAQLSDFG